MPSFPIIDTHVHFWDAGVHPIAWIRSSPMLDRAFLPPDLEADRDGVELGGFVFVEADVDAGLYLKEAAWAAQLSEAERRLRAVVAHAPLEYGGAVGSELEKLAAQPIVKGVRRLIQGRDAAAICGDRGFREAVRMLPRFGLHFELCPTHDQMAPVLDLVRACPDVAFVLDHLGKPAVKAGRLEPWWQEIGELAADDRVVCKISGLVTEADHAAWTEDELSPFLDRALDAFGPERVMFGSDWPVMRQAVAYPRWVDIVDRAVADWSDADCRKLFVDNATRVYRLD